MAFEPKKIYGSDFNGGIKYSLTDGFSPEDFNNLIEGLLYAQENGGVDQALVDQVNSNTENIATLTAEKVSKTDYAGDSNGIAGVIKYNASFGTYVNPSTGVLSLVNASEANILAKQSSYQIISPKQIDYAVKVGITTNTITLTEEEKTSALEWLGATEKFAPYLYEKTGKSMVWQSNGVTSVWTQIQSNDATAVNGIIPKYRPQNSGTSEYLGWLLTHTPVNDYQCANKKYVDDSIARWHGTPFVAFSWEGELATSQSATMDYLNVGTGLLYYNTLDIIIKLKSGAIVNKQIFPNSFSYADTAGTTYGFTWSFINDNQTIAYKILDANSPTPTFQVINYSASETSKIVRVDVIAYK